MMIAFVIGVAGCAWSNVPIDEANFPDAEFRRYISEKLDPNNDGILTEEEIANVKSISNGDYVIGWGYFDNGYGILSLKGLETFTALEELVMRGFNTKLTELDVSKNTALINLDCSGNKLTILDVSNNTDLRYLRCGENLITKLDISNIQSNADVYCDSMESLTEIKATNATLSYLDCHGCSLVSLDLANAKVGMLICSDNELTYLDVCGIEDEPYNTLDCDNNRLTELRVSNLYALQCRNNQLTKLDCSDCPELAILWCDNNKLSFLNVSNCSSLWSLICDSNYLSELDVSNNQYLIRFIGSHVMTTC